jgi:hypothetical protein
MQSAALLASAETLGIKVAVLLIVAETQDGGALAKERLEAAEKGAGLVAAGLLSL